MEVETLPLYYRTTWGVSPNMETKLSDLGVSDCIFVAHLHFAASFCSGEGCTTQEATMGRDSDMINPTQQETPSLDLAWHIQIEIGTLGHAIPGSENTLPRTLVEWEGLGLIAPFMI